MTWITAIIAVFAAAALAAAVWNRLHARHVMKNLNRMLDAAMAGIFLERDFDESLLSAVESRFAHYLAANAVSAQKLQEEKDKIKTLIADISHQTKTPVANILLYAQLLSEQELSPEGRDCAGALEGQVEKLRALVDAQRARLCTCLPPVRRAVFLYLWGRPQTGKNAGKSPENRP